MFSHVAVLKEVGLDVPQVTDLFDGLARGGVKLPGDVIGEAECVQQLATLLESVGIHPVK